MGVVGFDLGNESCVVAVARERGVNVVLNGESKGETPAIVCFGEKQRFLGAAGAASSMMNPKNTISQIKRLLGRQFSDPELQRDLKALPFTVTEGPDGFPLIHAWYLGESRTFKPTQLLAMVLSDMKSIAEKNLNAAVVDCCIGIPVYFTDLQRRAVLDAAAIAGLHPLRLLHETTATAMAYGIYKTNLAENDQINIAFVDIGHASMQVCVARLKKGQLKILAHSFDRCLGGRDFDEALFKYFAAKFKEKYKIDAYQNARASFRLRNACEKLKKVLSANPEAPLNIECLMEEKDVKGFIKREDFEKISIPILERVRKPLEKALSQSGLTVENIDAVEVVGSGSRVPAIIRILTEFFRKEPRRTMNSSECVAKGCALECAILSSAFELQEFQVNESFPFTIAFSWRGPAPDTQNGFADDQVIAIGFPMGTQIPCTRTLTFFRSGTFTVHVQYADVSELQAPAKISSYTIGPFQSAKSERVKVLVEVRLNPHGIVSIDSAAYYEEENVEVPKNEANKIKKTNIPVVEHIYGGMCPADVQKATEEEFEMAFQDRIMEETKDKKNVVEAYVYDMRNKLHGEYQGFVTDAEREGLTAKLQEVEDWLYKDGEDETKGVYIAKLEELKKQGNPIEKRYKKLTEDDDFLEDQEGVNTETVERIAESRAPSVEPSHACEGVDKHCLVPSTSEVPRSGLPRNCREDDSLVSRFPDGSASVRLGAEEEIRLYPRTLFAEVREEHRAILSNIFELWPSTFVHFDGVRSISRKLAFDSLVSFVEVLENMSLPRATSEDFDCARDGLEALKHFRLEIGWLRKRLDQMASLVELPVAQNQLEEVGKEIEEMEEVVRQLKDKKQGLMRRVSKLESAGSGGFFDLSSHAGQGLRG